MKASKLISSLLILTGVALLVLALVVLGTRTPASAQGAFPPADGKALFDYITKENPYANWGHWPDDSLKGFLRSGPPHGNLVRIFVNDVALAVAKSFPGQLPEHSIVVKENYMSDDPANPGPIMALTVMYKVKGFDPAGNDWFWLKVSPQGEVDMEGKVAMCTACHLGIPGNKDGITRYGFGGAPAVTSLATQRVQMPAMPAQAPATLPTTGGQRMGLSPLLLAAAGLLLVGAGWGLWRWRKSVASS